MADLQELEQYLDTIEAQAQETTKKNADLTQQNLILVAKKRHLSEEVANLVKQEEIAADIHVKAVQIQAEAIKGLENTRDELQIEVGSLENRKLLVESDLQLAQTASDTEIAELGGLLYIKRQELAGIEAITTDKHEQISKLDTIINVRKDTLADFDVQISTKEEKTSNALEIYDIRIQEKHAELDNITADYDETVQYLDECKLEVIATERELTGLTQEKTDFETKKNIIIKTLLARESSVEQREKELDIKIRRAANKGILDKV